MRLAHLVAMSILAGAGSTRAVAQIPAGGGTRTVQNLPRLMVSNPYVFQTSDSAVSVQIGTAVRLRMDRVSNNVYTVISREDMNKALREYTYPPDAILLPQVQRTFALSVSARVLLSSTLARNEGGRLTITARLAGLNDDAGTVVTASQQQGQSLEAFGNAMADGFQPTVKAAKDAKACVDQRATDAKSRRPVGAPRAQHRSAERPGVVLPGGRSRWTRAPRPTASSGSSPRRPRPIPSACRRSRCSRASIRRGTIPPTWC